MDYKQIIEQYLPSMSGAKTYGNLIMQGIPVENIRSVINHLYNERKLPLKFITATDERKEGNGFKIIYIFGIPKENLFLAPYIQLKETEDFPSLMEAIHAAYGYERKIKTFFGLNPINHINPAKMILHENWPEGLFPLRKDFHWQSRPAEASAPYVFGKVEGEGIYEISVGPVHAGIIEPGHFRFSVAGEEIINLESKLGYVHKGSEKLFEILDMNEKVRLSERISGDTSFTHSLAFCQAVESLAEIKPSFRAKYLRVIYSELERLANHLNDIGFIMLDTGYSFGGSNGARLREMIMQINERLTGSRFLRGVNVIGGVTKDIPPQTSGDLLEELASIKKDFSEVINIVENSDTLLNRLKDTGKLGRQIALDHGAVGIAAKGSGIQIDARVDFPYAAYNEINVKIATEETNDVYARFRVRIKEVFSSVEIISEALKNMPEGELSENSAKISLKKNCYSVDIAEGWRGDIVYFVATDADGNISRVAVRDPSFVNWAVVGHAVKGNVVPDFPLINKSFNLSYSGNDL
ncbi:MAG: NADH-quinone oxidoreductase subunit C [bacterium]|nr:NADH-quinone oxidoreductase subunit C [bacterium]